MLMIIGGAFQGKLEYACEYTGLQKADFLDGEVCGYEEIYTAKGIHSFQSYVRRQLADGLPVDGLADEILQKNPSLVLITNEIGYGIVPMEAFERRYRETCGRICCSLAGGAAEVHRVACGIGKVIKP